MRVHHDKNGHVFVGSQKFNVEKAFELSRLIHGHAMECARETYDDKGGAALERRLGDRPIEPEYIEKMNSLARGIDRMFNGDAKMEERETGFVLLVYKFGDVKEGRCNFISNGSDRRHLVTLFKEMIARFEGQPEIKGTA